MDEVYNTKIHESAKKRNLTTFIQLIRVIYSELFLAMQFFSINKNARFIKLRDLVHLSNRKLTLESHFTYLYLI